MISSDPRTWTLTALAKAIRRRDISPVEVTRSYLERIYAYDDRVNSFITLMDFSAMKAARRAEKETLGKKKLGLLHGIPFAAKDLFFTKGIRTTCGTKILAQFVPSYDAAVIERLYAAGAILLGKLNMHEFAFGATSVNPHFGAVRNPWDLERVPGGSSGGSAAALACSFAPLTLGTDTGGSIRIPSALCGTAGLKPTYGRISRFGVYPLSWSLDHPGPMARTVADLALAMNVLAGHDPRDPAAEAVPVPDYTRALGKSIKGIRVGIPDGFYFDRLDPQVRAAVRRAIADLRALGASVRPVSIPALPEASTAAFLTLIAEGAAALQKWNRTRPREIGQDVRSRLDLGEAVTAPQYILAQRIRRKVRSHFLDLFQKVDALVTPQLPITAPRIGEANVSIGKTAEAVPSALTRFTRIYNLVGLPALSLPCGFSAAGMPIGLQIAAKPFAEGIVLRLGHAYETATPWKSRNPVL